MQECSVTVDIYAHDTCTVFYTSLKSSLVCMCSPHIQSTTVAISVSFSYSPGTQELGGVNLKVKMLRGVTPPPESDSETSSSVGSAACTTDVVHMKVSVYSLTFLWATYIHLTSGEARFSSGHTRGGSRRSRTRNCAPSFGS